MSVRTGAGAARLELAVVPDFSGEAALLFEARTLFFLASWLHCQESDRPADPVLQTRVRLCCIGEPPGSVRRLTERAGGAISVHEPVEGFWGGFANKLRGLEDLVAGGRRLVLDADMLVLAPPVLGVASRADYAAAVAGKPQVPQALWERLYAALELPMPVERLPSLRGRLGLGLENVSYQYAGQGAEAGAMPPYYNSGVLLARGGGGLRQRWEEHLRRILQVATDDPEMAPLHALMYGDQVGLATALQSLGAEGGTFALLPDACHVRLAHLRAGAMRWREVQLFHATGFLRGLRTRTGLPRLLDDYAVRWGEAILTGTNREPAMAEDAGQPAQFLQRLWERWVRAEWED